MSSYRKSELLVESNPIYKKIPVLIHNGKDQAWNKQALFLPSDPFDRAVARFWTAYIDDKLTPAMRILRGFGEEPIERGVEDARIFFQHMEEAFRTCSKGKDFFGGDEIGYLDIALGSRLGWIRAAEKLVGFKLLDEEKTPRLALWAERFCASEAVKCLIPETAKLLDLNRLIRSTVRGAG